MPCSNGQVARSVIMSTLSRWFQRVKPVGGCFLFQCLSGLSQGYCSGGRENISAWLRAGYPAQVEFEKPDMNLQQLLAYGNLLVDEQENVRRVQLADSYLKGAELVGAGNGAGGEEKAASLLS